MTATKTTLETMSAAELIAQTEFKPLRNWRPTALDCRGLGCDESNDDGAWLVVASYTPKTADMLGTSNWETLQELLQEPDPDGNDHIVLEFGHWATDIDVLIVRPGSDAHRAAELAMAALADYHALDEEDLSRREYEQQYEDITAGLSSLTVYDIEGEELDTDNPLTVADAETTARAPLETYLVHQVWEHMCNDDQPWRCLEETGRAGGGGVDRSDVERALEEMGYERIEDGYGEWIAIGGVRRAD